MDGSVSHTHTHNIPQCSVGLPLALFCHSQSGLSLFHDEIMTTMGCEVMSGRLGAIAHNGYRCPFRELK